jgi:predicted glutamine amidotransferase
MCELMAMSFIRPIHADFSIREFAERGEENADGWGMAWYPDQSCALVKEPRQWHVSPYSAFLKSYKNLQSTVYVAHVRHRTVGGPPTRADTHPFLREWGGRDYCFAHNGTVRNIFARRLRRFHPLGGTDSEHLFCWLMDRIAQRKRHLEEEEDWRWLHGHLKRLNLQSKLNCLLADGLRLFCYFDSEGHKGLNYRPVYLFDETRCFGDATVELDLADDVFNRGIVIASNPLSSTGWKSLHPGEMIVLEKGERLFSSHDDNHAAGDRNGSTPAASRLNT